MMYAFPTDPNENAGMTLRDYFAGQAITGFDWEFAEFDQNAVASLAYRVADAMIAEREKVGE